MTTKAIGPTFAAELTAAMGPVNGVSWTAVGEIMFDPSVTSAQQAAVEAVYAAHDPTKPDPNAASATLLAGGVAVTSTGTAALTGTYACDLLSQQNITSEQLYIATTGKFTNGTTSKAWPDINGVLHTFLSPASFTAFAEAVAAIVDAVLAAKLAALQPGGSWTAPSMAATIA